MRKFWIRHFIGMTAIGFCIAVFVNIGFLVAAKKFPYDVYLFIPIIILVILILAWIVSFFVDWMNGN